MRAATLVALGLTAVMATGVAGQQPTFRSGVETIEIDAVVTDREGNPVTDLAADDFEVLENGKRQTISSFSLVDIPRRPTGADGVTPSFDVVSNGGAAERRRLYVFAIGALPEASALKARRLLRQFVERHMSPGDIGALVYITQAIASSAQPFTTNHQLLLDAIDRVGLPTDGEYSGRPMRDFRALAESIASIPVPRKTMLLVTTGFPDIYDVIDYQGGVGTSLDFDDYREAIRAATRGNIAIYTIDSNGLHLDDQTDEATGSAVVNSATVVSVSSRSGATVSPRPDRVLSFIDASMTARSNLRALAEMTGGLAVVGTNNFADAFRRIERETSTYYLLGYVSTDNRQDGRFRKLSVRVTRPGLEVRARSGYVAPKKDSRPLKATPFPANDATDGLKAALGNAIATPGLPIEVFAAPFKGTGDAPTALVPLAISVDLAPLGLVEQDGVFTGELELGYLSVDGRNRVIPGEFRRIPLSIPADAYRRSLTTGVRVLTETRLPAGRHQIRVAAGNGAGVNGSVVYDVDVPNFTGAPLVLSGVALAATGSSEGGIVIRHRDPVRDIADSSPLTTRAFTRADTVTIVAVVYDNRKSSHLLSTTVELRTADGRRVLGTAQQMASSNVAGGARILSDTFRLNGVEPGHYVVRVEASSSADPDAPVTRNLPIEVR